MHFNLPDALFSKTLVFRHLRAEGAHVRRVESLPCLAVLRSLAAACNKKIISCIKLMPKLHAITAGGMLPFGAFWLHPTSLMRCGVS